MFFIIETQVNNGTGSIVTPIQRRDDQNEAESVYHSILAVAATSDVDIHGAMIIDEECFPVLHYSYKHKKEE